MSISQQKILETEVTILIAKEVKQIKFPFYKRDRVIEYVTFNVVYLKRLYFNYLIKCNVYLYVHFLSDNQLLVLISSVSRIFCKELECLENWHSFFYDGMFYQLKSQHRSILCCVDVKPECI